MSGFIKRLVWMILFSAPFLGAGVYFFYVAITTLSNDSAVTVDVIGYLIIGTPLIVVPATIVAWLLTNRLRPNYSAGWKVGRIASTTPGGSPISLWVPGVVVSGVSVPLAILLMDAVQDDSEAVWGWLFPVAGLGLLGLALFSTLRWVKYGMAVCQMVNHPGIVGGWFKAIVWSNISLKHGDFVTAELTCFHMYTEGGGEGGSETFWDVEWHEKIVVDVSDVIKAPSGQTGIPFSAYVPRECRPSTQADSRKGSIRWELTVEADVPGIDFSETFTVPVFVTKNSRSGAPPADNRKWLDTAIGTYHPTINVREYGDELELYAGHFQGAGINGRLIFHWLLNSVFSAFFLGTFLNVVPRLFFPTLFPDLENPSPLYVVAFGVTGGVTAIAILWRHFAASRLQVNKHEIVYTKKLFGIGRSVYTKVSGVVDVKAIVPKRSGSSPIYTITLVTGKDSGVDTIGGLRSKEEAEELCSRIRESIGLKR